MSDLSVHFSSETSVWETPQEFFDQVNAEFNFTTDVCALPQNAKCEHFFSPSDNGLSRNWTGACWMNPPYGREIGKWIKKAYDSACEGSATVACLLPARTDARWFHDYCAKGEVRFIKGRIKYSGHKWNAPFPNCLVIFYAHLDPGGITKWITQKSANRAKNQSTGCVQAEPVPVQSEIPLI